MNINEFVILRSNPAEGSAKLRNVPPLCPAFPSDRAGKRAGEPKVIWRLFPQTLALAVGFALLPSVSGADRIQSALELQAVLQARTIAKLDTAARSPASRKTGQIWGLLVNGAPEERHQYNICHAYDALKAIGVEERNIFVLSRNFPRPDEVMYDRHLYPCLVHARPSKENFLAVIQYLGSVVASNDTLVIYLTGHGSKAADRPLAPPLRSLGGEPDATGDAGDATYLCLEVSDLGTRDFEQALVQLEQSAQPMLVFVADECFAGGFANVVSLTASRYVAIASTDDRHLTACGTFAPGFWKELAKEVGGANTTPSLKTVYEQVLTQHEVTLSRLGGRGVFDYAPGCKDFALPRQPVAQSQPLR